MAIQIFKVIWHYEAGAYGGKKHFSEYQTEHIAAANGLPATLDAVLTSAGGSRVTPSGHVRVFDSIANEGSGNYLS
jgi:hypothetical protein